MSGCYFLFDFFVCVVGSKLGNKYTKHVYIHNENKYTTQPDRRVKIDWLLTTH